MHYSYEALFEAIRAKCQRDRWFGPGALKPEQESLPQPDDPFCDEYAYEVVAADDPARFSFVFPPASEEQVRTTEDRLDFPLPSLLHQRYTRVANGGFGPGAGIPGVKDGYTGLYHHSDGSLWAYREQSRVASEAPFPYEQAARSVDRGQRASMRVPLYSEVRTPLTPR